MSIIQLNYNLVKSKLRKDSILDPISFLNSDLQNVIEEIQKEKNTKINLLVFNNKPLYFKLKENHRFKIEHIDSIQLDYFFDSFILSKIKTNNYDLIVGIGLQEQLMANKTSGAYKNLIENLHRISETVIWQIPLHDVNGMFNWAIKDENYIEFSNSWDFLSQIGSYKTNTRSIKTPFLLMSKKYFYHNTKLYCKNKNLELLHRSNRKNSAIVVKVNNKVIKCVLLNNPQKSSLLIDEFNFLNSKSWFSKLRLNLPPVYGLYQDSYIACSSRKFLSGIQLDNLTPSTSKEQILQAFLTTCIKYAKNNIFLNDLRPWNVLWDGKECKFIDFEYASNYDQDVDNYPQIIYFFAVANYIENDFYTNSWDPKILIDILNYHTSFRSEPDKYYNNMWVSLPKYSKEVRSISYKDLKSGFLQLVNILGEK